MLLAAGVTALLSADTLGVRVVGSVPEGIPVPALPSVTLADLTQLVLPAVGVAIVAYSDNVLTGRAFATRNKPRSTPTRRCSPWARPTSRPGCCRASR